MITYEVFKEEVTEKFMSYMPEQYKGMELRIHKHNKVNRILDGINVIDSSASRYISPTLYINDMYDQYTECADFEAVMKDSVEAMVAAMEKVGEVAEIDPETAKDNIVFQVINTEQNREMLAEFPHREFLDLSIIYRLIVEQDEKGIQSAAITNSFAKFLGFTEEQLFKLATLNTRRMFPPVLKSVNDILKKDMPEELAALVTDELPEEKLMWVISNDRGISGAASMLFEDTLHKLALEIDDDLYLLPSSTHEVLATKASGVDPYECAEMVAEVNMTEVPLEDRLSNQVYHYDKDLRRLALATDTPNKRLDGAEADS